MKVYGKTVGYNYLTFKINTLGRPVYKMDCVDLGKDFFLNKFHDEYDYDKVLRGGLGLLGNISLRSNHGNPISRPQKLPSPS